MLIFLGGIKVNKRYLTEILTDEMIPITCFKLTQKGGVGGMRQGVHRLMVTGGG